MKSRIFSTSAATSVLSAVTRGLSAGTADCPCADAGTSSTHTSSIFTMSLDMRDILPQAFHNEAWRAKRL